MKYLILLITFLCSLFAKAQSNCTDSSSHFQYRSQLNDSFRVTKTILTANNDKVSIGFFLNGTQWSNTFLLRVNSNGTTRWFKKFTTSFTNINITPEALAETNNGNIIIAANNINAGDKPFSYWIFSPDGDMLFQNEFGIPGNPYVLSNSTNTSLITKFGVDSMLIVLTHAVSANASDGITLVTISNNGIIGQATTFIPPALSTYASRYNACRIAGKNIFLYGGTQFATNSCRINFFDQPAYAALQIDWNSKQVVSQKVFCSPPAGKDKNGFPISEGIDNNNTSIALLENGNIAFSRRIWGLDFNGGDTLTQLFKISTFDPSFNHIKSEYICTRQKFQWWADWDYELYIDPEGMKYVRAYDLPNQQLYYATGNESGQFTLQKKLPIAGSRKNHFQNISQLQEPGYSISFSIVSSDNLRSYIDNIRILAQDEKASCFGTDFDFLLTRPATVSYISWPGAFTVQQAAIASNPLLFSVEDYSLQRNIVCNIVHKCDSIKLTGPRTVCNLADPVVITAHKNPACDGNIDFVFDTAQVQSYLRVNDTTLQLHFNKNYKGKIFAKINTCDQLKDSLEIIVGHPEIQLGNDTTYCPGKNYLLNAYNPILQSYTWQDGSTDSIFVARTDGLYYVTAKDYCNNVYSDTLRIIQKNIALNLGRDTTVCINEKLWLSIPDNYLSYHWTPAPAIIPVRKNSIEIHPEITTLYSVEAEVFEGCILSDTIQIAVISCPEYIYFPNSFTPNNDKLNDSFQPKVEAALERYELSIYNRWGALVFKTTQKNEGWNGEFKGVKQTGTFVWQCRYQFYGKPEKFIKGVVTIIK